MNTIFKNLLKAIGIMCYFIVLNFAYTRMNTERLMNDIEIFSGLFIISGLIMLERAYKKDDGKIALSGIELLCLSMHSLSVNHVITFYQYDFRFYLLTSSYVFAIYYVLKTIVIYTKEKRQYLKTLSDISEIVKEEPIKKEAKKRRKVRNTKKEMEDTSKKKEEINQKQKTETKKQINKKETEKEKNNVSKKEKAKKDKKVKKEDKGEEKQEENKKKNRKKKKEVVNND